MKWLLLALIASWVLAIKALLWMNAPGAEFDRAFPTLLAMVIAVVLTIAYVFSAIWFHKLW